MNDYHHTILSIPLLRQTEAGDLSHNEWTLLSLLLQQCVDRLLQGAD